MTGRTDVLFIQGGGAGVHDDWDARLVDSLAAGLGDGYAIRYPRMPHEDDPTYDAWRAAIDDELRQLGSGAVVVGHSVGATILVDALTRLRPAPDLGMVVLLAAPFVGAGGWPGEEFEHPPDLGDRLPPGVPVHVFHGLADETVEPSHADLYARAIPQGKLHLLPGRDHQLQDDLSEVAGVIGPRRPAANGAHRDREPT